MNHHYPIYTERRECQDCYKCVRHCPVKAIKIEGGFASVMADLCTFCGQCVEVCPNGAKKVRDDLPVAQALIASGRPVWVSLAPSYVSEFPELQPGQVIRALRHLGFRAVSETALGAQEVSAQSAALMRADPSRALFSSACPTVVRYLQRHRSSAVPLLARVLSPLLTHCTMLRQLHGPELAIVFIGPCIAKKLEAAEHPELLDAVLTFDDLRRWWRQERVDPEAMVPAVEDRFLPQASAEGAWYPVDGGMIAGMKSVCAVNDAEYMAFSGFGAIERAIAGLEKAPLEHGLFLELLACEGGCVNGPRMCVRSGTAAKRSRVLRQGRSQGLALPRPVGVQSAADYSVAVPPSPQYSESQIREALLQVGKHSADDELNCGGCGYDSCRAFAAALIGQKAERSMCVTHMRKLAQKKAHALMQKMLSAAVIVDEGLRIIEFNDAFADLVARCAPGRPQRLEGLMLSEVFPFAALFHSVLKTGRDIPDRDLRLHNTILHAAIFSIEKHRVVGGIFQDITEPAVRKEQVIQKAQEVIQKNLATVQKIAYLLGENAAESEITLNTIIDSFTPRKPDDPAEDHDWRKLYRR